MLIESCIDRFDWSKISRLEASNYEIRKLIEAELIGDVSYVRNHIEREPQDDPVRVEWSVLKNWGEVRFNEPGELGKTWSQHFANYVKLLFDGEPSTIVKPLESTRACLRVIG